MKWEIGIEYGIDILIKTWNWLFVLNMWQISLKCDMEMWYLIWDQYIDQKKNRDLYTFNGMNLIIWKISYFELNEVKQIDAAFNSN